MNTGIQDSISLAEALTSTLRDGDEARLDAWAAQRHKVATDVVTLTDRMTRLAKRPRWRGLRREQQIRHSFREGPDAASQRILVADHV
jgi:2-polyprenyl-6-methoxyphenol hydroxylase-like FAD-dependent oxidoreductase